MKNLNTLPKTIYLFFAHHKSQNPVNESADSKDYEVYLSTKQISKDLYKRKQKLTLQKAKQWKLGHLIKKGEGEHLDQLELMKFTDKDYFYISIYEWYIHAPQSAYLAIPKKDYVNGSVHHTKDLRLSLNSHINSGVHVLYAEE